MDPFQGVCVAAALLTSPTETDSVWTIFSCAMATTLCPFISMILWPTRTPPRSAMPPRIRLQIWGGRGGFTRRGEWQPGGGSEAAALSLRTPPDTHDAVLHAETQLELEIGPLDEDRGDGRAAHDAEFDLHLILQTLEHEKNPKTIRSTLKEDQKDRSRTLMMPWQAARGSPTRLVSLMDIIWSPTLSFPERAAGPLFCIPARMTVGRMEPQPDSTITTPRLSPFCFSRYTYNVNNVIHKTLQPNKNTAATTKAYLFTVV